MTTDLRLNQPRYVKLPEILKAKTKPLAVIPLASLGVDARPQFVVERHRAAGAACQRHPRQGRRRARGRVAAARRAVMRASARSSPSTTASGSNASTAKCVSCARAIVGGDDRGRGVRASAAPRVAAQAARLAGVDAGAARRVRDAAPLAAALAPQVASARRRLHARARPVDDVRQGPACRASPRCSASARSATCMAVLDAYRFKRPIYAGNAIVTVRAPPERKLVATVRIASYPAVGTTRPPAPIETRAIDDSARRTRGSSSCARSAPIGPICRRQRASSRAVARSAAPRTSARLYELADALGAAVGASRAAVDSGFVANELAGGPDGQDHRAGALHRDRHLGRDPAPHGHQGRAHDRRDQSRSGGADLRGRRHRARRRSVPGALPELLARARRARAASTELRAASARFRRSSRRTRRAARR